MTSGPRVVRALPRGATPALAAAAGLVAMLLVSAWLWPWRLYGFDPTDEGVQLVQIDRVLAGERPQVDFETSYTPGYFGFHAALLRATGGGLATTRTFGVLLQAATVGLGVALAAAWGGIASATVAALLAVGFLLPFSLRSGAPFNVPYPGWLAMPLALLAQASATRLALVRAGARRVPRNEVMPGLPWAIAAGVAAGCAFSIKPNAGLLALAGSAVAATAGWRGRGAGGAVLSWSVRAAAAVATWVLLRAGLDLATAVAFGLPVLLALLAPPPGSAHDDERVLSARRALPPALDLLALGTGFLLPVLPWAVRLVATLGLPETIDRVLHLDGSVVRAYAVPIASPVPATLALLSGVVVAAALACGPPALARLAPSAIPAGLAVAVLAGRAAGVAPRLVAENASPWIGPLLLAIGSLVPTSGLRGVRERALVAFAAIYHLQVFPRVDLIHVAMAAPPLLLASAVVGSRLAEGVLAAARRPGPLVVGALALATALACGRALPTAIERAREPVVPVDLGPRAPIVLAARHASDLDWLSRTVRDVRERSRPGDPVFAFPDLPGLGWLAGRPSPWTWLYFVPGRPSREDQALLLAEFERHPPAVVVLHANPEPAFVGADAYYDRLADHLARGFAPAATHGDATVLVPRR
ncbi:hypothetical protein KGQ64_10575 [bacterium]|nr:hypothetical protein [bacterium]